MNTVKELIDYWKKDKIITDRKVLDAFQKVERENFISEHLEKEAYADVPLPIGYGQTISQPTTIALMTEALELKKGLKVLEVGTGSGYQAALIANIIGGKGKVITTEIIPQLAEFARANLKKAKIMNVIVLEKDGSQGHKEEAPYDRIIVTAAAPEVPKHLLEQLKEKGILLAPVGDLYNQEMLKVRKLKNGKTKTENLGDFVFVPLRGSEGF